MAQGQTADGKQFTRRAGASEPLQRQYKLVGNASCITDNAAAANDHQVCHHQVRTENQQLVAAEEWKIGQRVHWHDYLNAGAGGISALESDAPIGYAVLPSMDDVTSTNVAKSSGDLSAWINVTAEARGPDLIAVIDFASASAPKLQGSYLLRDYSAEPAGAANIASLELVHDGNLAPGTATIQLGTLADPDAIYGPVDFTAIGLLGAAFTVLSPAVATPGLSVPEVVLTITVADASAGKLRIALRNTAM